jgi:hypothetical protein
MKYYSRKILMITPLLGLAAFTQAQQTIKQYKPISFTLTKMIKRNSGNTINAMAIVHHA